MKNSSNLGASSIQYATASAVEATKNAVQQAEAQAIYATEQAGEAVKEVAKATTKQLEDSTNQALEFLGIPVDIHALFVLAIDWGMKIILALLIFFVGKWIGKRVVGVATLAMKRSRLDNTAANFLGNILYGLMLVMVVLAALNKLGVNTNSFVAVLGAAAVAIGVSLKDQLGNLAAGVMIVIFRPFSRGDHVEVGGRIGQVMDITLVNTRIKTPNNHEVVIPNGDIMTTASINYSSLPQRRVDVIVGIDYGSDIKTARSLMIEEALRHEHVLKEPEPIVRVTELSESSVDLTLYVWAENENWLAVRCDLLESIKYSFDKNGVSLPFPQRTLHLAGVDLDKLNARLNDPTDNKTDDN